MKFVPLILAIYRISAADNACLDAANDPHCVLCSSSGCKTCIGSFLGTAAGSIGTCIIPDTKVQFCLSYSGTTPADAKCSACYPGYFLSSGATPTCTAYTDVNCLSGTSATVCTLCTNGTAAPATGSCPAITTAPTCTASFLTNKGAICTLPVVTPDTPGCKFSTTIQTLFATISFLGVLFALFP